MDFYVFICKNMIFLYNNSFCYISVTLITISVTIKKKSYFYKSKRKILYFVKQTIFLQIKYKKSVFFKKTLKILY